MTKLYALLIIVISFYIFYHSRWYRPFKQPGHDKDPHPKNEKLTMFDVRQLLIEGKKDSAIRVYCELFKTNTQEAREAVEEIERSIQPKDFER